MGRTKELLTEDWEREWQKDFVYLLEEQKRADAMREANMQSLAAAGQIAGQVSGDFAQVAQNDIYAEQENALLQQMQSGDLSAEEQTQAQQYYNFIRLQRTGAY